MCQVTLSDPAAASEAVVVLVLVTGILVQAECSESDRLALTRTESGSDSATRPGTRPGAVRRRP
eukprot:1087068-Rhodomonas_salina.2